MLEVIEKLLVLQDRDRRIRRVAAELAAVAPQRQALQDKAAGARAALERARQQAKEIETRRNQLELEIETKKGLIAKYSQQQFQTRKNDEYQALTHEIEMCKEAITKIEDQEIELMEQGEAAQREVVNMTRLAADAKKLMDDQLSQLGTREENLKSELSELEANRGEIAAVVDDSARGRYERLIKSKGENVVVGVQHGVCGGCHMRLPAQILVSCQAQQELVSCTNCGRILYYTRDMDLAVAE